MSKCSRYANFRKGLDTLINLKIIVNETVIVFISGLAKQGSYWYLDTRREEFDRISPRTSIAQSIAKWADSVNEWLKNCPAVTIIHGMCFLP